MSREWDVENRGKEIIMRRLMAAFMAAAAFVSLAGAAQAQSNLVVVELYTSQGCSSCPPADALLHELAERDDVLPLALHVDYWDYIGWKDQFANPKFTKRQKAYAHAAGQHMIYTPQMIVGGQDHVVGNKPMHLARLIETHAAQPVAVQLSLRREGEAVVVSAPAVDGLGDVLVQLVRYIPEKTVEIGRGENAGRTITYSNVVTDWQVLGPWDGSSSLGMRAQAPGAGPVVIVLQKAGHKAILAAVRLR